MLLVPLQLLVLPSWLKITSECCKKCDRVGPAKCLEQRHRKRWDNANNGHLGVMKFPHAFQWVIFSCDVSPPPSVSDWTALLLLAPLQTQREWFGVWWACCTTRRTVIINSPIWIHICGVGLDDFFDFIYSFAFLLSYGVWNGWTAKITI